MKIVPLAMVPLCLFVSSCSVMDVLGPRPNAEIVGLARQAEADALSLGGASEAAGLRSRQAADLWAEVARLCGVDAAGAPPSSCVVVRGPGDAMGASEPSDMSVALRDTVAADISSVPEESTDLVVSQAVDAAALVPVDPPQARVDDSGDLTAARAMLEQEYSYDYALGLALSVAGPELAARIGNFREAGADRREYLSQLLAPSGPVPVPAAGYEFTDADREATPETAQQLVDDLNGQLVSAWRRTAANAQSTGWSSASISLAASAQRASLSSI
ncbi:hypothetical protein [Corynebacterium sp.]|uniref:hypothetical protein n=1 Tax=Corynebacterium sp. TaxID=1720 RepID=UPI002A91C81C|nr:hypothetical protein [Corynebacterium sp.]MDY5785200.1 hypothetical protein [Corynebacterium sp.]